VVGDYGNVRAELPDGAYAQMRDRECAGGDEGTLAVAAILGRRRG